MRALVASPLGFPIGLSVGALGGGGRSPAPHATVDSIPTFCRRWRSWSSWAPRSGSSNCAAALASRLATTSIDWGTTIPFTIAAVAGVTAGGRIADRLDAKRSLRWFAALLVAVAVYTAIRSASGLWAT